MYLFTVFDTRRDTDRSILLSQKPRSVVPVFRDHEGVPELK